MHDRQQGTSGVKPTRRDPRKAELAKIHIAAEQLGMDTHDKDENSEYRSMLWTVGRVRSAANLDAAGRARVLDHLKAIGFKARRGRPHPGKPHNMASGNRAAQL